MSDQKLNKINAWREDGKHLPPFMRDFHDQKDLFKWMHHIVSKNNADKADYEKLEMNFRDMHLFTVDFFLWFMAQHGYTLQKTKKKLDFYDIEKTVGDYREQSMEQSANVLKAMLNKGNDDD